MARIGIWVQRIAIVTVVAVVGGLAVRVGTSASEALAFRDPTAWLASSVTGDVVLANALTGEVQARVEVGNAGDSLAVAPTPQGLVAINRSKGEAVFVDPATEKRSDRRAVSGIGPTSVLLRSNAGPRLVSGSTVVAFEGPIGDQIRSVDLPEALTSAVATAKGAVYGVGAQTGSIRRVTDGVSDVQVQGSVAVSLSNDEVYAVTGGDQPIVAHLEGTDPKGARPCAAFAASTPGVGAGQSDDGRFVVVADGASGRLSITDLDRRTCRSISVTKAGSTFGAPVVDAGTIYVPVYSSGDVVIVPTDGDVAPSTAFGLGTAGKAFDLFAKDHFVWFNDPVGKKVAVLSSDGVTRSFNKYDSAADGTITTPGASTGKGNTGSGSGTGSGATGTAGATSGTAGTTPGGAATTAGGTTSASGGSKTTGEGGGTGTRSAGKGTADPNTPPPDSNALVADFTFSSSVVPVNEKVTFTDKSTGAPTAWTWDFGDNSFAAGPKVDKSWAQPGFYIVKLTVEANGNSSIATTTIEVTALEGKVRPKANFGFSTAQAEVGQPITFTDKSTGSPTELKWSFGDDATGTGSPVQHIWAKPGTFTVVLAATNSSGTDSAQATITIFAKVEPPVAKISPSSTAVTVGQSVSLLSTSTGNPTSLQWTFGDGSNALGATVAHQWRTPGDYAVTLVATNSAGSSTDRVTITVREVVLIPEARLQLSAFDTVVGETVRLTSLSINNPTTTAWNFGDGTTATGPVVDHAWRSAGTFKVTITVANSAGSDSAETTVTVVPRLLAPVASFTFAASSGVRIDTKSIVQFTDGSTGGPADSWSWDFGDGSSPSNQRNPTHPYTRAGGYDVTLTVTNNAGSNSRTLRVTVVVPPPAAAFTFSPTTPRVNADVQFTDASTDAASVSWNFGDGSQPSTDRNPTHRFGASQAYTVTLTVENASGSQSTSRTVNVNPLPPVAAFLSAPGNTVRVGDTVTFTNASTGGAASPTWTFSDSTTPVTTVNASRTYNAVGTYTVTLTMTNVSGSTLSSVTITVLPQPPAASFTYSPSAPRVGQAVTFTSTSTGTPTGFSWTFGDGGTATTNPASHTFATAGDFVVTLAASNSGGTSSPSSVTVRVLPLAPVANFTTAPALAGTTSTTFAFTSTSTGVIATTTWTFGDTAENTASGVTASHRYRAPGTYTVTITVTGAGGSDTHTATVVVTQGAPTAVISCTPTAPRATEAIACSSSGSYGSPFLTYAWSVTGPGAAIPPGTSAGYSFAPSVAGTYVVTLTVTNALGTSTTTANIVVAPPP